MLVLSLLLFHLPWIHCENCMTVGGAVEGAECRFPFIYLGSLKYGCITDEDPDQRPWCSTKTNQTNHHIKGNWGHCASTCFTDETCTTSAGSSGSCMTPNLCIGVDLQYLQANLCGEDTRRVCCTPHLTNLKVDLAPVQVLQDNFIPETEDRELEDLFREIEEEIGEEENKLALDEGIGFRQGGLLSPQQSDLSDPAFFHNKFNKPKKDSTLLDKTSNIFLKVTKKISEMEELSPRTGLNSFTSRSVRDKCPWFPVPSCAQGTLFRSHDGTCNNLLNPNYGRSGTPFQRIILPDYGHGSIDLPRRRQKDNFELPPPRVLSNQLTNGENDLDGENTLLLMQFGQFLDHDLTHTPTYESINCCKSRSRFPQSYNAEKCFPLRVEKSDTFWNGDSDCMEFSRSLSSPDLNCNLQHREQLNQVSHWMDGSNIYGSSEEDSSKLRGSGGFLKISGAAKNNLPSCEASEDHDSCDTCKGALNSCFFAGDVRVNEQPNLVVMHTVFLREHNRLVQVLSSLNSGWDDERLYQEARRINIAQYQHIVYQEWLPIVLGNNLMTTLGLLPLSTGFSTDYDDSFDPRINNEFAAAAFRFGHSLVTGSFAVKTKQSPPQVVSLRDTFFKPVALNSSDIFDGFIRGLVEEESRAWDSSFVADLRNHLFEGRKNSGGLDLVAINIQRGRDHGVPGYVKYLELCTGQEIHGWEDLQTYMEPGHVDKLKSLYKNIEDVDLFVGGFMERSHLDSLIGTVFKCIIGDQFARLKKGDRFFYDLGIDPNLAFTEAQLDEIRKVSIARVLCENTEIGSIQPFPFKMPINQINSKRSCEELISIKSNWNVFKE